MTDTSSYAKLVAEHEARLKTLEQGIKTSQLNHSSLENGSIPAYDASGQLRQIIGKQADGTYAIVHPDGPPPPAPTQPAITPLMSGLGVTWSGALSETVPADFDHVEVYVSTASGVDPTEAAFEGTLRHAGSLPVSPLTSGTVYYVRLVAVSNSGARSGASPEASGVPLAVVADDILDGIVTETKLADDAVTAAKIAAGAVGTGEIAGNAVDLSKLADGSVDATKLVAGAVGSTQLSSGVNASISSAASDAAAGIAAAAAAQTAADLAQATADGAITTYYQSAAPTLATNPSLDMGDLWYDSDTGQAYRWSGSTWVLLEDNQIAAALAAAATAQSTADGKIVSYWQSTTPTGASVGDIWFDTSRDNLALWWDGTYWHAAAVGTGAISSGAITSVKIGPNAVTAGKIDANAVTAGTVAAGVIGANQIAANAIVAGKIDANAVTASTIAAGSVQAGKLAVDSVQAGNIAANAVTAREINALAVTSDKIAANAVTAGQIAAGSVTADKLESELILGSTIIAGDPDGWHLEMGDQVTPILWTNNDATGLAVTADPTTGISNVSITGQLAFGSASSAVNDWIDLSAQQASGYMQPKMRQVRNSFNRETATTSGKAVFGYTTPGNFLIMSIIATGLVATPPTISTPSGWTQAATTTSGTQRMSLFIYPNCPYTKAASFTFDRVTHWSATTYEYSGLDSLDLATMYTGTGATASVGPTATTTQANELWFVSMGSRFIFADHMTDTTNGFEVTGRNWADPAATSGVALITGAQVVSGTGTISSSSADAKGNSVDWLGVAAAFKAKAVTSATAPTPPSGTARHYTAPVAGVNHALVRTDTGSEASPTGGYWSQYTRGSGAAISPALTWVKIGGYTLAAGTGGGLTASAGSQWTLASGIWQVKVGLRTSGSGNLMIGVSPSTGTTPASVYPGGEASFPGVATGSGLQPGSLSLDIPSNGSNTVCIYAMTTATPTIIDGVVSFNKIG